MKSSAEQGLVNVSGRRRSAVSDYERINPRDKSERLPASACSAWSLVSAIGLLPQIRLFRPSGSINTRRKCDVAVLQMRQVVFAVLRARGAGPWERGAEAEQYDMTALDKTD